MKKQKLNIKKIFIANALIVAVVALGISISSANAYNCKPGDKACEEAKANMQKSQTEANDYIKKADSISEIIEQLDGEINELNDSIAANELKIRDLNKEIKETEAKLRKEQAALAEMLVNMHFKSDSEPIRILAGSKSISDFAEKTAREEVARQEITAASNRIKEVKHDLDIRKGEFEAMLEADQNERTIVASKREDQSNLRAKYEQDADDATVAAEYWEKQLKALAWTPPSGSSGGGNRWAGTGNTYPYAGNCPQENATYGTQYGGYVCQCTDYASYKAYERWGVVNTWLGHAYNYVNASGNGIYVNNTPAPHTIAVQPATWDNPYGHVMWVESVNSDGSINISEYNVHWPAIGCYMGDYCSRSNVGTSGMSFVHFE